MSDKKDSFVWLMIAMIGCFLAGIFLGYQLGSFDKTKQQAADNFQEQIYKK